VCPSRRAGSESNRSFDRQTGFWKATVATVITQAVVITSSSAVYSTSSGRTSNAALLSHVMVDALGEKTVLINSQEAYVGKALDEGGRGEDLETFAGANSLRFLSSKYTAVGGDRRKLLALFESANVQSGLSAEVTALIDVEKSDRQLLQREILPKLPGQKLPQTTVPTVATQIRFWIWNNLSKQNGRSHHVILAFLG
jgi:hypothetical protein